MGAYKTYKGFFRPNKPDKYMGDPNGIVFRSLWELRAMKVFDANPDVLRWASEEIVVPYISPLDNRPHRYFVDFWAEVKQTDGSVRTFLIEVKPKTQLKPPNKPARTTKRYLEECLTYAVNEAKWKAAIEVCKRRNWEFIWMTEDELGVGEV